MSGRNFGEIGDFGSGEFLLGIFGNGKFLLDLIIFAEYLFFGYYQFSLIFSLLRIVVSVGFLGHLGGVGAFWLLGRQAERSILFYFGFLLRG